MGAALFSLRRRMQGVDARLEVAGVESLHDEANAFGDGEVGEEADETGEHDWSSPLHDGAWGGEGVGKAGEGEGQGENAAADHMRGPDEVFVLEGHAVCSLRGGA